jgi:hypothetical protein
LNLFTLVQESVGESAQVLVGESAQVLVLVQGKELVAVLVTVAEDRAKDWVWEPEFLAGEED